MSAALAVSHSSAGSLPAPVSGDPARLRHAYTSTLTGEKPITAAVMGAAVAAEEGEKEEEEIPTASSSLTSSLLSSSTPSISSSTTTDTSVASDVNAGPGTMDRIYEDKERELMENGNTMSTATITDIRHATMSPVSSSSTSLPAHPPTSSSSASNVCSSAVPSLLQQQPQQPQQPLNVRFAPLPEMAPRKRKSRIPLGMAARGQLARRRRALTEGYDDDDYYDYNETVEEERRREEKAKKKAEKKAAALARAEAGAAENKERWKRDPKSDPIVALATKMGQAGKHIWRKVSNKDAKIPGDETGEGNKEEERGGKVVESSAEPATGEEYEQMRKDSIGGESLVLDFESSLSSLPPNVAPEAKKVASLPAEGKSVSHPHTTAAPITVLAS